MDPALIPLLRGTARFAEPLSGACEHADQRSFDFKTKPRLVEQAHLALLDDGGDPVRAIKLGVLLSLLLWAVAVFICHWLLA